LGLPTEGGPADRRLGLPTEGWACRPKVGIGVVLKMVVLTPCKFPRLTTVFFSKILK